MHSESLSKNKIGLTAWWLVGIASGVFSTVGLSPEDAFWRPPLFFWLGLIVLCWLVGKRFSWRMIALLPSFFLIHVVASLFTFPYLGSSAVGGAFTLLSTKWALNLKGKRMLVRGELILAGLGLVFMLVVFGLGLLVFQGSEPVMPHTETVGLPNQILIIFWQAVAIWAIRMQIREDMKLVVEQMRGKEYEGSNSDC